MSETYKPKGCHCDSAWHHDPLLHDKPTFVTLHWIHPTEDEAGSWSQFQTRRHRCDEFCETREWSQSYFRVIERRL